MTFTLGLQRALQQRPQTVATICETRVHTYEQLGKRVAALAGGLASLGYSKGDRIAILSLNSDYYLESYLAIAWSGAVFVPLNFRWSAPEITYALNDSGCTALIIDERHAPAINEILRDCPAIRHIIRTGKTEIPGETASLERVTDRASPIPAYAASWDDLLGIFYTGGTTGRSKGVMLTHGNLCASGLSALAEGLFPQGCTGLHVAPMFHLADMLQTTCLLMQGATHVMLSAFTPDAVLGLIQQHQVTDSILVPSMIQMIVDSKGVSQYDVSSLRRILYGASPIAEEIIHRTQKAFPGAGLTQGYGMTETAALIAFLPASEHNPNGDAKPSRLRSAGRSAYHVLARIVDEQDQELPRGKIGEIAASGPGIMQGYLNQPGVTAEALRGGWMHTGDLGWMDDAGYIYIVDRAKDMIISGGENIYSVEVENAIASHPAIAAAAVIGVPDGRMGESVHAVLVLKGNEELTLEMLREHCRPSIAGYKIPRSFEVRTALPISAAGKVLKTELRAQYHARNI
jgi:acyl-CoA synthetase (AMP-forming)/AMP-acid ligase II